MSHVARERGAYASAMTHLKRSEAIAKELGLDDDVLVANTNLGELALAVGNLDEARRRWEHTMSRYAEDDENGTFALLGLGAVSYRQGRLDEAAGHYERARRLSERVGWLHNTTMALVGLAGIAADQGADSEAALLLGRASGLLDATGGERPLPTRRFTNRPGPRRWQRSARPSSRSCSTTASARSVKNWPEAPAAADGRDRPAQLYAGGTLLGRSGHPTPAGCPLHT